MRGPWTTRSNQSILKEIKPEYSLEGRMLKLQNSGYLMQRDDLLEKGCLERLRLKEMGWQRMGWLGSINDSVDMNVSNPQETVNHRGAWHTVVHGVAKLDMIQQLNNRNESMTISKKTIGNDASSQVQEILIYKIM